MEDKLKEESAIYINNKQITTDSEKRLSIRVKSNGHDIGFVLTPDQFASLVFNTWNKNVMGGVFK